MYFCSQFENKMKLIYSYKFYPSSKTRMSGDNASLAYKKFVNSYFNTSCTKAVNFSAIEYSLKNNSVSENSLNTRANCKYISAKAYCFSVWNSRLIALYYRFIRSYKNFIRSYELFIQKYERFILKSEQLLRSYEQLIQKYEYLIRWYEQFIRRCERFVPKCDERIYRYSPVIACSIRGVTGNTAITGCSLPNNAHSVAFSASAKIFIANNNKTTFKSVI